MDEHYIMNVIKAAGLKIDTLEFMAEEYKRNAIALEKENTALRMRIAELEKQHV